MAASTRAPVTISGTACRVPSSEAVRSIAMLTPTTTSAASAASTPSRACPRLGGEATSSSSSSSLTAADNPPRPAGGSREGRETLDPEREDRDVGGQRDGCGEQSRQRREGTDHD